MNDNLDDVVEEGRKVVKIFKVSFILSFTGLLCSSAFSYFWQKGIELVIFSSTLCIINFIGFVTCLKLILFAEYINYQEEQLEKAKTEGTE